MSSGRIKYLFPLFYFFCFLSLAQAAPTPLKDVKLVSDNKSVNSGQSFEANIDIDFGSSPAVAYSGFQFDVILPQDITFEDVTLAPSLADIFTLSSKMDANGSVRVIAYSSDYSSSTLENGIVTLKLKVNRAPLGNTAVINLNDVDLSSPNGVDLPLLDSDFTIDINIVAYSLELNPSELTLLTGQSEDITAIILPANVTDNTVTWSSQNESVAIYENGKILGLSAGTTTITATCGEASATCEVTVIPPEPEYIADTPTELLRKGDGTSHTFVAMMEKTDEVLEAEGYHYVFGYTNLKEGSFTLEDTPWRYTYTSEEVYWNSSNDFWVFAYFIDEDGMFHISSRRHLDGSVDEDFNPMDFIGSKSRMGEHIIGVYIVDGNYMGKSIESLDSGIYVVKTNKSSYKIIK